MNANDAKKLRLANRKAKQILRVAEAYLKQKEEAEAISQNLLAELEAANLRIAELEKELAAALKAASSRRRRKPVKEEDAPES